MKRRWHNIFKKDGKSVVLAMDHGISFDVFPNLNDPGCVIKKALNGGVDAILTTYGIVKQYHDEIGNAGLILRIDGGTTQIAPEGRPFEKLTNIYSIEDAVKLGVDGVLCMGFLGIEGEEGYLRNISQNASECDKWGLVLGAEMMPGGFRSDAKLNAPSNVVLASRVGAERGADFIKAPYTGSKESFKTVVDGCYKPVLVLGGSKFDNDRALLQMVKDSMDAGASGVVIGRNIWKHESVEKICSAIAKIVHENSDVEKALKELN